jgi:glycerophosphoryl diester phosphodiesterase
MDYRIVFLQGRGRFLPLLLVFTFFSCGPAADQEASLTASPAEESAYYAIQLDTDEKADAFYAWNAQRIPLLSAHRGGPYPGYPENAIETFEQIIQNMPAIIECDIMQTADGELMMMHDNTLDRTTTGTGRVNEVSWEYLQGLHLKDNEGIETAFKIPTLDQVLAWGKDKVVFTLDVKRGVPFEKVVEAVERHASVRNAVIITYTIDDAQKVHALNPDLRISISLGSWEAIERWIASGIPARNTVAFVGTSARDQEIYDALHAEGILCILGTMGNLDRQAQSLGNQVYNGLLDGAADILSTDRPLEAWEAMLETIDTESVPYTQFIKKIQP